MLSLRELGVELLRLDALLTHTLQTEPTNRAFQTQIINDRDAIIYDIEIERERLQRIHVPDWD